MKKTKTRKCKCCRKEFTPQFSTTIVCSYTCSFEYAKKIREKKETKEWKQRKKKLSESVMTYSDYCQILQAKVNYIARLIDFSVPCISSLRNEGKMAGGHRFSVGSFPALRFNLFNIHKQSFRENSFYSGNPDGYDHGLSCMYGDKYLELVHELPTKYHTLKATIPEIQHAIKQANEVIKELKLNESLTDPNARIIARELVNTRLGLYNPY